MRETSVVNMFSLPFRLITTKTTITIPFFFLFFLLCFNLQSSSSIIHHDLIEETCKKCSQSDPNIPFKFCTSSLKSHTHKSKTLNLTTLGLISIHLTMRNVSDTKDRINDMLAGTKTTSSSSSLEPYARQCLEDCLQVYSDAMDTLREAVRDYRARRFDDANIGVSAVLDASSTCEDGFNDKEGVVSPLTKRNRNAFQLAAIALAIINMLSHQLIN